MIQIPTPEAATMLKPEGALDLMWRVELARPRARKVAVSWTGLASGEREAVAHATRSAIVALRATAWRKGADGPKADLSLRTVTAETDGDQWQTTVTVEPPALEIPGVRRADERQQRRLSQRTANSLAADIATCALASYGPDAPRTARIFMGRSETTGAMEDREDISLEGEADAPRIGTQAFPIWSVVTEIGAADGHKLCPAGGSKCLDGALMDAVVAVSVACAHGIGSLKGNWPTIEADLWPQSSSATLRAARIATLPRDAEMAANRLATFLRKAGLDRSADELIAAYRVR